MRGQVVAVLPGPAHVEVGSILPPRRLDSATWIREQSSKNYAARLKGGCDERSKKHCTQCSSCSEFAELSLHPPPSRAARKLAAWRQAWPPKPSGLEASTRAGPGMGAKTGVLMIDSPAEIHWTRNRHLFVIVQGDNGRHLGGEHKGNLCRVRTLPWSMEIPMDHGDFK